MDDAPVVSVVIPSHARPLRLRWLLNALHDQTFPPASTEVVVVHHYEPEVAARVFDRHPLAAEGRLRQFSSDPGAICPSRLRNLGWRAARGDLVAFIDDDCRPEPEWLETLVAAAQRQPGRIVQGFTRPDPYEVAVFAAPHVRTLHVHPPGGFAQTCNILYPRAILERLDGFDERAVTGEDIDLALRARSEGIALVGEPAAVVNHAIEAQVLWHAIRSNWKWRHLAYVVKRHPEMRRHCRLRLFWEPEHLEVLLALAGLLGFRRWRPLALLAYPYLRREARHRGRRPVERLVAAAELPGRAALELAEVLIMAAGSVEYRTLVL